MEDDFLQPFLDIEARTALANPGKVGKHIETNVIGKAIAYIGKDSFYVMALHL